MKIAIRSVDHTVLPERPSHPNDSHIGQYGEIVGSYIQYGNGNESFMTGLLSTDIYNTLLSTCKKRNECDQDDLWAVQVLICKMDNGSVLELTQEEIEIIDSRRKEIRHYG